MAIDQRDWYRDLIRKRTRYIEKSDFRKPVDNRYFPKQFRGSFADPEHWDTETKKSSKNRLPFFLLFAITIAICGGVFLVLKIITQVLR